MRHTHRHAEEKHGKSEIRLHSLKYSFRMAIAVIERHLNNNELPPPKALIWRNLIYPSIVAAFFSFSPLTALSLSLFSLPAHWTRRELIRQYAHSSHLIHSALYLLSLSSAASADQIFEPIIGKMREKEGLFLRKGAIDHHYYPSALIC
jgi:hypothetical protein